MTANPLDQWGQFNALYGGGGTPSTFNGGLPGANLTGLPGGTGSGSGNPEFQFGANLPTAQLAMGGLSTIGNLWGAFQSNKLAKNQFDLSKRVTEANLNNQISSYNTALSDRARSRGATEGQSQSDIDRYVAENRLR